MVKSYASRFYNKNFTMKINRVFKIRKYRNSVIVFIQKIVAFLIRTTKVEMDKGANFLLSTIVCMMCIVFCNVSCDITS